MIRPVLSITLLAVQLIITSCTGYGLIYDDVYLETDENEQNCLKQPDSNCLLELATSIAATMSEPMAQAETLAILAKTHFELGNQQAALDNMADMEILALQFNSLFELSALARNQDKPTTALFAFAELITPDITGINNKHPADKLAALLLGAILYFEDQQPQAANLKLKQAIKLARQSVNNKTNNIDPRFFRKLLPKLIQFKASNTIKTLIATQADPANQISAQASYLLGLEQANVSPPESERSLESLALLLSKWHNLQDSKQKRLAQASIVKLLIGFNRLKHVNAIRQTQTDIVAKIAISALIVQQLTAAPTNAQKITIAKRELVRLLKDIRQQKHLTPHKLNPKKVNQTNFMLDSLRAQAIADLALGLSKINKMSEAVRFAEQIQVRMAHIQGYTLTRLAMLYVNHKDINAALLTMESIDRPVNRAACLAQISAEVAKYGNKSDLARAITIANRIDRQSWRDIAYSEISIAQTQLNDISSAMITLETIQRSYSAVYAMTGIARTLQASKNKR